MKTILKHVKRFQAKYSVLKKRRTRRSYMLAEKNLDDIGARWRHLQKNQWFDLRSEG
jgi:thermostable 8-oxoguanine DNA glycosylase